MRLGINIDHVATLRNARGGEHPNPIDAARVVEKAGADLLVAHLREDRRHIKEKDIDNILKNIKIPLQLEVAPTTEMFDYVIKNKIKKICIVPEKREKLTTEGGLNLKNNFKLLKNNLHKLFRNDIEVSFFINPDFISVELSEELGVKAVELHTGSFANASIKDEDKEFDKILDVTRFAIEKNFSVRAGHGLTYKKVAKIIQISEIDELNIGHFIIGEAIFDGLENVIKKMRKLLKKVK